MLDLLIDFLSLYKKPWDQLTAEQKKAFNLFIINRLLSQHPQYNAMAAKIQLMNLSHEQGYNLYLRLLPKKKISVRFIVNEKTFDTLVLIDYFCDIWSESRDTIINWLNYMKPIEIKRELQKRGLSDKEIKKRYGI